MKTIILSSKKVESDLAVEFGNILPVEIPLLNRTLLSHQIESVKNISKDIFLTIPENYKSDLINYENIKTISIKENKSLIEVLNYISSLFANNDKLFIYYGDSLFLDINLFDNKNYFFVQKSLFKYKWGEADKNGDVPSGGIIVDNILLKEILCNVNTFDELVQNIKKSSNILFFKNFRWLDFGHSLTYYNSRKQFLETRHFNKINFNNDYIVKSSSDIFKMWCEFNWLQKVKQNHPLNIPYVCNFELKDSFASYSIEYIYNPILSDIFVFGKLTNEDFVNILLSIKKVIIDIRSMGQNISYCHQEIDSKFLISKLLERKDTIIEIVRKLDCDVTFITKLIQENIDYFTIHELEYGIIHGDLCFSNIIFNFTSFQPVFIDPRGYTSRQEGFSLYGPLNYDIYKLAHSFVLGYDFVIADYENHSFFNIDAIEYRFRTFCEIFEITETELKIGLKHLFITMLPLHCDSRKRQLGFIKILNLIEKL